MVCMKGRDTTACALSWQHLEMLRNPRVYDEVVREAKEIGDADAFIVYFLPNFGGSWGFVFSSKLRQKSYVFEAWVRSTLQVSTCTIYAQK